MSQFFLLFIVPLQTYIFNREEVEGKVARRHHPFFYIFI